MSLEVREMVVKSNVVQREGDGSGEAERAQRMEELREEVLQECERMIRRQLETRGER